MLNPNYFCGAAARKYSLFWAQVHYKKLLRVKGRERRWVPKNMGHEESQVSMLCH